MSSSSQGLNFIGTGELVDVLRSTESMFRNSNSANVAKSLLDGNRDHLPTQARSELMKQEHKVESLNNCISELQQQAYAQRLELEDAHHGYVESRRQQVRLQEELVMKEKVVRDTQNPKHARNGRNEESSRTTS